MSEYTGETINITPNWEVTTEYVATVIAEHGFPAGIPEDPQCAERVGSRVDQIADAPQLILGGIEPDLVEKVAELARAAVDVAHHPTHARIVAGARMTA